MHIHSTHHKYAFTHVVSRSSRLGTVASPKPDFEFEQVFQPLVAHRLLARSHRLWGNCTYPLLRYRAVGVLLQGQQHRMMATHTHNTHTPTHMPIRSTHTHTIQTSGVCHSYYVCIHKAESLTFMVYQSSTTLALMIVAWNSWRLPMQLLMVLIERNNLCRSLIVLRSADSDDLV